MTAGASPKSPIATADGSRPGVIDIIDPCSHPQWDGLVEDHPLGSLFTSSPWLKSLAETYGLSVRASVTRDATGSLVGGLPFVVIDDEVGVRARSLPFSDYCDPMSPDSGSLLDLVKPILAIGAPVSVRVLHDVWVRQSEIFDDTSTAFWHGTSIAPDTESAWAKLRGSSRRNIRHARDAGVSIRVGTELSDVMQFHQLHGRLRKRKYQMLAQPASFFEALYRNFSPRDGIVVLLAELDGDVVAGTLYLQWGSTLYYKFNASIDTATRPNDLLAWEGIELAARRGLQFLDFGLSDADQPGLVRFKEKFADTRQQITTLTWKPSTGPAVAGDFAEVLGGLTTLFTDPAMPDELTLRAGDLLYRYLA